MKNGKAVYVAGKMDKKAATAYGRYNNTLMSTGWGVLEIRAGYGPLRKNHDLMYAAGFLEGVFTARYKLTSAQGFMQDKIIASHTCFGGHMDVNC